MDSSYFWKSLTVCILLLIVLTLTGLFSLPDGNLHVIACDVGQGDATLITYKNNQILIDGGPDNSVLNCLGRHMPFYDRELELVILTHPDTDHFVGLIEVLKRYDVDILLKNDIHPDTQPYRVLEKVVGGRGIKTISPYIGQKLRLGLIYLDTLWPSQSTQSNDNNYSIVNKLSYGSFKALFTGDLEEGMKDRLLSTGLLEPVDYIKTTHHGSRNGITNFILDILRPNVAVISAGKNNKFGHPHKETLDLLKSYNVKVLRTDELGDIEIISDGKRYWSK